VLTVRQQGSVTAKAQLAVIEFFEIVVGAAGFVTGQAAEAAIDRLPLEGYAGGLDLGDDVVPRELRRAGALEQLFDGVEDGVSAAGAAVRHFGLERRDGDGGSVDRVVAVRTRMHG